jgi:membrane protein
MQGSKEPLNENCYKLNALVITHLLVKNFADGKPAISAAQVTKQLHLSSYTVDNSLAQLVKAHVISISSDEIERTYQPAVDTDLITITYVLQALSQLGLSEKPVHSESYEVLNAALLHFQELMQTANENKRLKDIA